MIYHGSFFNPHNVALFKAVESVDSCDFVILKRKEKYIVAKSSHIIVHFLALSKRQRTCNLNPIYVL